MLLANAPVSVRSLTRVWHIGTLDRRDKGRRGPSFEGDGLSVSVDPDAWEEIAKLGGLPRWVLTNPRGRFVEFHALTEIQRTAIADWGITHGLVCKKDTWALSYYDEELEDRCTLEIDDEAEACETLDDLLEHDPDSEPELKPAETLAVTSKLCERIGFKPLDAFDVLVALWAEDETTLDGVWWADRLAPELLSAPRGVIVRRALPNWRRRRIL